MKRFILVFLFVLAVSPSLANAASVLDVGVNRAELISVDGQMSEVIVANPLIADVVVHSSNKISVIGKKIGTTNVRFFSKGGKVLKEVDVVVGYDMPNIRRKLKEYYPDLRITVDTLNNSLAVAGVVPDSQTANRVMQIVYEFVKESRKDDAAGGGGATDFTEQDNRFPGVVNLLSLNSSQQVMLKVRIGELKRTALKKLGVQLNASQGVSGGDLFSFITGAAITDRFGRMSGTIDNGDFSLTATLDMLEQDGLFKLLAEPNLTTVSGETANFLAGGEFPIQVDQGDGALSVEFKKYGVSLSFVPFVLSSNRIRVIVEPELSEIDTSVAVGGVPGLTTRRAKTTVELAPGESFMVAGLIRDQLNAAINEIPGVAEVPIISALMRSTSYQRSETELVIAVTPYVVDPVINSDIRMPVDEYRTPSDMEMFFYGALGAMSGSGYKSGQKPVLEGPIGYMVD